MSEIVRDCVDQALTHFISHHFVVRDFTARLSENTNVGTHLHPYEGRLRKRHPTAMLTVIIEHFVAQLSQHPNELA